MAYRLKTSHPFSGAADLDAAVQEDRALFRAAAYAADRGLISRRSFLRASSGVAAWLLVAESRAFAEKVAGRKGYAVQGILGRDQLLGGVVAPENADSQDTLSAAWGKVRTLGELRNPRTATSLAEAPTEFTGESDGATRTHVDHGGIRPHLTSPFDEEESYVVLDNAQESFRRHERGAQERVREALIEHADGSLGMQKDDASGTRFVIAIEPTPVWCNRVGTVAGGSLKNAAGERLILPAGTALTYHGRLSNSVLVNHPMAAAAARGRATFVDARNLADLAAKQRLLVRSSELSDDYLPSEGCLQRTAAEHLCKEESAGKRG
ncbi:MAG: hypothetical protein AAFU79_09060 [Myxococcota bacterium]